VRLITCEKYKTRREKTGIKEAGKYKKFRETKETKKK